MSRPWYEEGLEVEDSDLCNTLEDRQRRLSLAQKRRLVREKEQEQKVLKHRKSFGEQVTELNEGDLDDIFRLEFSKPVLGIKLKEQEKQNPKQKILPRLRPSSRQRKRTNNLTHKKSQVINPPQTVSAAEEGEDELIRSQSGYDTERTRSEALSSNPRELLPTVRSSQDAHSSFNLSHCSLDFEEENVPPPQYIPEYFEYQQKKFRVPNRRNRYK